MRRVKMTGAGNASRSKARAMVHGIRPPRPAQRRAKSMLPLLGKDAGVVVDHPNTKCSKLS